MKRKVRVIVDEILSLLNLETNFDLREPPEGINFDLATNLPLSAGKKYNLEPKKVVEKFSDIAKKKYSSVFSEIVFAEPGFMNFNFTNEFYFDEFRNCLNQKESYPKYEKNVDKVLIEFVSANPTGPLHIGHGRCAVIGDVLGNILEQIGFTVSREYYINDRGRQIDILTSSVILAGKEFFVEKISKEIFHWAEKVAKESMYKGEYIKDVAKKVFATCSIPVNETTLDEFKKKIVSIIMDDICSSLEKFKVKFDNYFSETSLYTSGYVNQVLNMLKEKGSVETYDGAVWFKSTTTGDDKDRVLIKSNSEPTYFLSDIAYHLKKISSGYTWLINIWGTDHHGYVPRLVGSIKNIAGDKVKLDIILYQLVSLLKDGIKIQMSTREGTFVTLDEVVSEIGVDVTRYFLLTKSPNAHLEFDFNLAKEHSMKNPVYYIQYAHTRCCGIFREANVQENKELKNKIIAYLNSLAEDIEFELMKKICFYEDVLLLCYENLSPHYLCTYLLELAKIFHKFYETCRVVGEEEKKFYSRLGLVWGTKIILNNGLKILGITAPEKM